MAKRLGLLLPILAAFLFIGITITANADKPLKEEELITLYAGPLLAQTARVSFTNHTDRTLAFSAQFFHRWADTALSEPDKEASPRTFSLPPHSSGHFAFGSSVPLFVRVELSYIGFRNEMRGTFCANNTDGQIAACVPLED